MFSAHPAIGFVAHARQFSDALAGGKILAPAKAVTEMQRIIFNDYVDATMSALFVAVVVAVLVYGLIAIYNALNNPRVTAIEIGAAGATM